MAFQLSTIIGLIEKDVKNTSQEVPHIIYFSIGSAAGLRNENGLVDDKNYHQYPPCLQQLQEQLHSAHFHIILIDPILENPPYLITDHSKGLDFVQQNVDYYTAKSVNQNIFHVFAMRENVYIDGQYSYDGYHNITHHMFQLNAMCMHESILMIYNDFTGRDNKYVAEFFDDQVSAHLDHIVYGIGARKELGCYIDLTSTDAQFAFKFTEQNRHMIKVFNIFNYLFGGNTYYDVNFIIDEYGIENIDKISAQISCVIDQYIAEFKGKSLGVLKGIHRLIHENDMNQCEYIIGSVNLKYKERVRQLIDIKSYYDLQEYMINIYSRDLDIICKLKNDGNNGFELLKRITRSQDPYQWYNELIFYL
jgi:hypothetical protein